MNKYNLDSSGKRDFEAMPNKLNKTIIISNEIFCNK